MNYIKKILIVLLTMLILSSCEKENISLTGKWIHTDDYSLDLEFKDLASVLVNGNQFLYKLIGDSIEFTYSGPMYIYITPSRHKYELHDRGDYLMIGNLDKLWFFRGEEGENYLRKDIEPNKFIGTWVSESATDTLYFKTNSGLERLNNGEIVLYEYSFTDGSLTIQIISPVFSDSPMTSTYVLEEDTLTIDYSQDYPPDIKAGTEKYIHYSW